MCFFLAIFILIQQGKSDMGLTGALGSSSQMLFGGSGGQTFFEKATWAMGIVFILGSLGLSIAKSKITNESELSEYAAPKTVETKQIPVTQKNIPATQQKAPVSDEMETAATPMGQTPAETAPSDNNDQEI
jgi:protein translocase SecG subunit